MITTDFLLDLAAKAMALTDEEPWAADTFLNKETAYATTLGGKMQRVNEGRMQGRDEGKVQGMDEGKVQGMGRMQGVDEGDLEEGKQEAGVEWHPLIPFLPEGTRLLFLGSFPPQRKRWCMDFFYPNFINDHWRIEGLVFGGDAQRFVDVEGRRFRLEAIVRHLKERRIGFFDTAIAVRRLADNASDKFLEVVEATDIGAMVARLPELRAIVTTGEKATATIAEALGMRDAAGKTMLPKVGSSVCSPFGGIELYRLPSSSRAYPMSLAKKAEAYKMMFERFIC